MLTVGFLSAPAAAADDGGAGSQDLGHLSLGNQGMVGGEMVDFWGDGYVTYVVSWK